MKRTLITSAAIAVLLTAGVTGVGYATGGDDCVPADAWTETIEHPEVSHEEVIEHPEVSHEETVYTRYSYTKKGDGADDPTTTGSTPETDPDHWQASSKAYDGSALGTYHQGQGNGSWFWWTATTETIIDHEAWTETVTVIDHHAYVEVIEHEAVTCDDDNDPDPEDPTDEPTEDPTEDPTGKTPTHLPLTPAGPVPVPSAVDAGQ